MLSHFSVIHRHQLASHGWSYAARRHNYVRRPAFSCIARLATIAKATKSKLVNGILRPGLQGGSLKKPISRSIAPRNTVVKATKSIQHGVNSAIIPPLRRLSKAPRFSVNLQDRRSSPQRIGGSPILVKNDRDRQPGAALSLDERIEALMAKLEKGTPRTSTTSTSERSTTTGKVASRIRNEPTSTSSNTPSSKTLIVPNKNLAGLNEHPMNKYILEEDMKRQEVVDEEAEEDDEYAQYDTEEWNDIEHHQDLPESVRMQIEEEDPESEILYADQELLPAVKALSRTDKAILQKFFKYLDAAQRDPKNFRKKVWSIFPYIAEQERLASVLNRVAWMNLWYLENQEMPSPRRAFLGDTMIKYNADMNNDQTMKFIEGLFWYGRRDEAVQMWQLGCSPQSDIEWWNMGVRMFATENNPDEAAEIVQKALAEGKKGDAMTFLPVIVSYLHLSELKRKRGRRGLRMATIYRMKAEKYYVMLKESDAPISHKQYSRVTVSFLEAGWMDLAIQVHVDMIKNHPECIDGKQNLFYTHLEGRLPHEMDPDPTEKEQRFAKVFDELPAQQREALLMNNWMSYLIRREHFLTAITIANEMQNRGYSLKSSRSWMGNRLLNSFTTKGRRENMDRLGTAMIEAKINKAIQSQSIKPEDVDICHKHLKVLSLHVNASTTEPTNQAFHRLKPDEISSDPAFTSFLAHVGPANLETFRIMNSTYTKLNKLDKSQAMIELWRILELPMEISVINQYILGLLRNNRFKDIPQLYINFLATKQAVLKPDDKTFKLLWKGLNLNRRKKGLPDNAKDFNEPRFLLCEMKRQAAIFKPSQATLSSMYAAFSSCRDTAGLFAAMHAVYQTWGIKPHDRAVRELIYTMAVERSQMPDEDYARACLLRVQSIAGEYIPAWKPLVSESLPSFVKRRGRRLLTMKEKSPEQYDKVIAALRTVQANNQAKKEALEKSNKQQSADSDSTQHGTKTMNHDLVDISMLFQSIYFDSPERERREKEVQKAFKTLGVQDVDAGFNVDVAARATIPLDPYHARKKLAAL